MAKKCVYTFKEGNMTMRNLLGGKGANLAEMTEIGLPVPQGFTITTEACTQYYEDGRKINDETWLRLWKALLGWKRKTARSSAILRIPFSFPFVPAQELPCPV